MNNNKGQALIEYVLILLLIAVATIAVVSTLGGYVKDAITKTSCSLVDKVYTEGSKPGEATCEAKSAK